MLSDVKTKFRQIMDSYLLINYKFKPFCLKNVFVCMAVCNNYSTRNKSALKQCLYGISHDNVMHFNPDIEMTISFSYNYFASHIAMNILSLASIKASSVVIR